MSDDPMDRLYVCLTHKAFIPCRREGDCIWSDDPVDVAHVREYQQGATPTDPDQGREAQRYRDALVVAVAIAMSSPTLRAEGALAHYEDEASRVVDAITDPANRDAVLRALGLREELHEYVRGGYRRGTERRFVTDWEYYTDE